MPRQQIAETFNPTGIAECKAWFRADRDYVTATGVSRWEDRQGSTHGDMTQTTGTKQPTVVASAVNGKQAFRFDGVTQFISSVVGAAQGHTVFLVYKMITLGAANVNDVVMDSGNTAFALKEDNSPSISLYGGNTLSAAQSPANGVYVYASLIFNAGSSIIRINGVQIASGTSGADGPTGAYGFGALTTGVHNANFELAEVIIYPSVISGVTLTAIETYLAARYAL